MSGLSVSVLADPLMFKCDGCGGFSTIVVTIGECENCRDIMCPGCLDKVSARVLRLSEEKRPSGEWPIVFEREARS